MSIDFFFVLTKIRPILSYKEAKCLIKTYCEPWLTTDVHILDCVVQALKEILFQNVLNIPNIPKFQNVSVTLQHQRLLYL